MCYKCGYSVNSFAVVPWRVLVGALRLRKNWGSHIDASHSRQPLVKGERLVRHEVNAVMQGSWMQGTKSDCYCRFCSNAVPCMAQRVVCSHWLLVAAAGLPYLVGPEPSLPRGKRSTSGS